MSFLKLSGPVLEYTRDLLNSAGEVRNIRGFKKKQTNKPRMASKPTCVLGFSVQVTCRQNEQSK